MNFLKIILKLFLLSIISVSCEGNNNYHNENNSELKIDEVKAEKVKDTLKFTKGLRSILQDSKGNFWIGSDQEGVCKFDGKKFTYYTTENGLCGRQVISIKEDASGTIWFGTSSGLCSFDGLKFNSNNNITQLKSWNTNKTDLWFTGNNSNEIIKIGKEFNYTIKNPIEIPINADAGDYGITGFSAGSNNDLWIAYYNGVAHFDGKSIDYIDNKTMNYDGKSIYMHVRSILEDSKGRLWIGNNGNGVLLKEGKKISHFSKEKGLIKGEMTGAKSPDSTLMHVFAIKEDSKGNIWFGDRDTRAWRYDGKEIKNFIVDPKLKSQHIWEIYEDKNGNLLFVMADNAIYKFNGSGFVKFL